ncbi:MAG: cytochrome C oxidase subunit IV family protein [Planctomycetota bacterium]|nr:cytochrome C oxidase subunit IV family protein [Planctomycetota bacterium]
MASPAHAPHHPGIDPDETLSSQEAHEHHVHVTPFWPMFWVFVILLVLTALTVWSSNIHSFWIGNTEIVVGSTTHILMALVIATVKAVLVGAYFMHLKYDSPMNTAVVAATIFALTLFIALTLGDTATRSVLDRMQHQKIMPGGNAHITVDAKTGMHSFNYGKNTLTVARENAKAAKTNPGAHGEAGHGADQGAADHGDAGQGGEAAKDKGSGH